MKKRKTINHWVIIIIVFFFFKVITSNNMNTLKKIENGFKEHRYEQLCVKCCFSSRTFNLTPPFPGWTHPAWRCHPGQHDLVRGNTCRTMMNGSVVPGRGEVTATFRGACQQDERSIQEVKEAPVCHRCCAAKAPI